MTKSVTQATYFVILLCCFLLIFKCFVVACQLLCRALEDVRKQADHSLANTAAR